MLSFNLVENFIASGQIIFSLFRPNYLWIFYRWDKKNKICSVRKFQFNFTHSLTKQKQGTRFWIECHSGVDLSELAIVIF